jgi:hypothetical protein
MGTISSSFAIACVACLLICMIAAYIRTGALNLFGAAAFVFVMFWVSRAVSASLSPPWSLSHYPLQDVVLLALLWATKGANREWWRVGVAFLLVLQLGFHAGYWALYVSGATDLHTLRGYILLNNLGLAGILLALSLRGIGHVAVGLADLHRLNGVSWLGGVDSYSRHHR